MGVRAVLTTWTEGGTRMKLTVDLVRDLANGVDIRQLKKLSATHMSFTALEDIR